MWLQTNIQIRATKRGCQLITRHIERALAEMNLERCKTGMLNVFLQHTSASLTINENADPDVRVDMEASLNRIAPENAAYTHTLEGPDDMPAHVKSSLFGCSLNIPVSHGQLALGTWQGVYLCEHRDRPTLRTIVLTLQGSEQAN